MLLRLRRPQAQADLAGQVNNLPFTRAYLRRQLDEHARLVASHQVLVIDPLQLLTPIRRSASPVNDQLLALAPLKRMAQVSRRNLQRLIEPRPKLPAGVQPAPPTSCSGRPAHASIIPQHGTNP